MQYRLQTNPFFVLGLPVSASQQDAIDAYEDRTSDDPTKEAVFAEARQALLTPRARLVAETGFLPDTSDGEARRLIRVLNTPGSDLDAVRASTQRLSPLSRGNILAWLSTHRLPDADMMVDLNGAQAEIDFEGLFSTFERARASAGIAPPTAEALREAVLQQFKQQNDLVIQAIKDPPLLAAVVGSTTKRVLALGDAERADRLEGFLEAYWRAVSRDTSDIRSLLDQFGTKILADPSDDEIIESYISNLKLWDRFGDPLQVFERSKGREDREAQSLHRSVRGLCLELANEKARSDVAYRITEAASVVFAELDRTSGELAEDLEKLKANLAFESCSWLERQADAARKKPLAFAAALKGVSASTAKAVPGEFLRELHSLLTRYPAPFDYPLLVARSLAVDLFNECKDTVATRIFTSEILKAARTSNASAEMVERLEKDLADLDRIDLEAELNNALESKNWATAEAAIGKLLPLTADAAALSTLRGLRSKIESKQKGIDGNFRFWLAVAAIVVIAAVGIGNDRQRQISYTPPSTYSTPRSYTPPPTYTQPNLSQPAPAPTPPQGFQLDPRPNLPTDFTETLPSRITQTIAGDGPRLSINEIRYCRFEQVRLEKIRGQIATFSGALIDIFNGKISDFNDRCSRYMYRPADLQLVERQVMERDAALAREAEAQISEWRARAAPATPPTSLIETKPNLPSSSSYTLENVRYCLYQEFRLSTAKLQISESSSMDRFRMALDEWNSLCQRYSYRPHDMTTVRNEIVTRFSILQAEGASLAAALRVAMPPAVPPKEPERQLTADLLNPDEVRRVQSRLVELGFLKGQADGMWGPGSRSAMRLFNYVNGLGNTDAAETRNITALFAATAVRVPASLPSLPSTYTEGTFSPPSGASLNPLNNGDAARINSRLRELGLYQGRADTLWSDASRVALQAFKQGAGLPADEIWDGATEAALFAKPAAASIEADGDFEQNISGRWSVELRNCQSTNGVRTLPIVITQRRASVSNQGCDFLERQGGGSSWTIRASCSANGETWIANIRLSRSGDRLTWSSERGTTVYRRCPS